MDGINGITGGYSLILFLTLLWINKYQVQFVDESLLLVIIISLPVFNFFNFRKKAACFAGDIGSISMAFIVCFLLTKLIFKTAQPLYILLLVVYGIDAVFTIIIRLLKKENVFLRVFSRAGRRLFDKNSLLPGRGVVFIDPKGDAVTDIIARLPEQAAGKVVLFDPGDRAAPPCLNVLQGDGSGTDTDMIVDNVTGIFRRRSMRLRPCS